MRIVIFVVLFSLVRGLFSLAFALTSDSKALDYPFPFHDPWVASIVSTAIMYPEDDYQIFSLEVRPERKLVPILENRNKMSFGLFEQKAKEAPLAFIISGTGAAALADRSLWLGKQLFSLGYHVVLLPNTMHFQFALGVSGTGAPGYTPNDAKEYYEMLKRVVDHVQKKNGLKVTNYSVVGYSLGALLAGFLKQEDDVQKVFNFDKTVLFNPAVDIGYAVTILDSYYREGDHMSPEMKEGIQGMIMSVGYGLVKDGFTVSKAQMAIKQLNLSAKEMKWLVGDSFRGSLRDIVYVSQQINDLGILKSPVTRYRQNGRLEEASSIDFFHYMNQIVVPNIESQHVSIDTLLKQSSMYAIADTLKSSKNVFIFENADDFFIREVDIRFMKTLVPEDKFFLYPYGGHCGNFWFPQNQKDFASVMKIK